MPKSKEDKYNYLNINVLPNLIREDKHAVDLVRRSLRRYGLYLGSDIRWMPSENAYYIYPKEN